VIVLFSLLTLVLGLLIFAVQNPDDVAVQFLDFKFNASKVSLLFVFLFVGAFIMNVWNSFGAISARRLYREFANKISELEAQVRERDARIAQLEKNVAGPGPASDEKSSS